MSLNPNLFTHLGANPTPIQINPHFTYLTIHPYSPIPQTQPARPSLLKITPQLNHHPHAASHPPKPP